MKNMSFESKHWYWFLGLCRCIKKGEKILMGLFVVVGLSTILGFSEVALGAGELSNLRHSQAGSLFTWKDTSTIAERGKFQYALDCQDFYSEFKKWSPDGRLGLGRSVPGSRSGANDKEDYRRDLVKKYACKLAESSFSNPNVNEYFEYIGQDGEPYGGKMYDSFALRSIEEVPAADVENPWDRAFKVSFVLFDSNDGATSDWSIKVDSDNPKLCNNEDVCEVETTTVFFSGESPVQLGLTRGNEVAYEFTRQACSFSGEGGRGLGSISSVCTLGSNARSSEEFHRSSDQTIVEDSDSFGIGEVANFWRKKSCRVREFLGGSLSGAQRNTRTGFCQVYNGY